MSRKAIVIQGPGSAKVTTVAIPKVEKDFIKVKNVAVALNPSDWKHIDWRADPGAVVGFDYAGYVEEVGPEVTKPFKVATESLVLLMAVTNTLNHSTGAFSDMVIGKAHVALRLPSDISFEEGATLGAGLTTNGLSLYKSLALPLPNAPTQTPFFVFVYGGSTATGAQAIQLLKLSGLKVITTCSPHNFDLVKSYGADAIFDYGDVNCGKKIREYSKDSIKHVYDTISTESSALICADAMSSIGGKYTAILAVEFPRNDCETELIMGYTINGEPYKMGPGGDLNVARTEDFEFGALFWQIAEELLAQGRLKAYRPTVGKGGLSGVLEGLKLMREGKVSGTKLVYRIADD